ncbi:MAG: hypothetical protein J0I32_05730 [Sphingobacteriales bacterium]|nr:hypothetical protein [Sphingobacteriales bacterium]OJW03931.1 MAG: hypothetical protein BGO52_17430 [Sphingobacteriales bacterium 44-61]
MSTIDFISKRDALIRHYLTEEAIKENEFLYGQYTIVSANLSNFLPEIDCGRHINMFSQLLLHKQVSKLEQGSVAAHNFLKTENLTTRTMDLLRSKPSIICTFHTGSYRIINTFLIQNKIPFTLAIGSSILAAEGEDYYSVYNSLAGDDKNNAFSIIDAENPKSVLQMLRELKSGRNLLLYLDGNSGAGTATTKNENRCAVNFLEQQIFARKGIGFLAHAVNVPIIPVINYRQEWKDIRLRFYDPILPDLDEMRDKFAVSVTQQLYDTVSPVIRQYPEQWEAWLYLHKVANVSNQIPPLKGKPDGMFVRFNLNDYGIFKVNKRSFIFQKSNYTSYPISASLYEILMCSVEHPVNKKDIQRSVLVELEEKGVLHYL